MVRAMVPTMTPTLFIPGRNVAAVTYPRPKRGVIKIRTHPSWLSSLGFWPILRREWSIPWKPRPRLHTQDSRTSSAFLLTAPTRKPGSGVTMSIEGSVPRRFQDLRVPRRRYLISTIGLYQGDVEFERRVDGVLCKFVRWSYRGSGLCSGKIRCMLFYEDEGLFLFLLEAFWKLVGM